MATRFEKNHLMQTWQREPLSALGLLLTFAASLLIVIVLALIEVNIYAFTDTDPATQTHGQ